MAPLAFLTGCDQDEMRNPLDYLETWQAMPKMCCDLYGAQGAAPSLTWAPQTAIKATPGCFAYNPITQLVDIWSPWFIK